MSTEDQHAHDEGETPTPATVNAGGRPGKENAYETRIAANAGRWHDRVRKIVDNSGQGTRKFATANGLNESTLRSWLNGDGVPGLHFMLQLHDLGLYPMVEQITDLCDLRVADLDPTRSLWQPQPSLSQIRDALERAVNQSVATVPSLHEVATKVDESCWESRHYGRWRTRFFDGPMGWHFPHLGYRGVEFLPWYGPGQREDPEKHVRDHYLELEGLGYEQRWFDDVDKPYRSSVVPGAFRPFRDGLPTDAEREKDQQAWDQCRHERMELTKRMGPLLGFSQGQWYGGYGRVHTPLLWHPRNNPTGRHILIQTVRSAQPSSAGPALKVADGLVHTILLIGPGSVGAPRIGQLVAEALDWLGVDYRMFAQRLLGRRVGLSLAVSGSDDPRTLTFLADNPPPTRMLMYINAHYLTRWTNGRRAPRAEALRLLSTPGVLPLLLTHGVDNSTSERWHARQLSASPSGTTVADFSDGDVAAEMIDLWSETLRDLPVAGIAEIQPEIPWAGKGTARPTDPRVPVWFNHPLVGDIQVRVAYEIVCQLLNAPVPTGENPARKRPEFSPGSTLHRFADELKARSHGDPLTGGLTEFNERYLHAPDEPPPTGRVVDWLLRPRRGAVRWPVSTIRR